MHEPHRRGFIRTASLGFIVVCLLWHGESVFSLWQLKKGQHSGADFASYYYAAEHARAGGNPYDSPALNALARDDERVGPVQPYFYPPPFLLLVAWSPAFELSGAYHLWFWLNELALLAVALVLYGWWREPCGEILAPLLALSVAGSTAVINLMLGQVNHPIMLATVAGLAIADRGRPVLGGTLLGVACMGKMSPALFVAWWLLQRRWTEVVAALACAVVLSLAALPLVGFGDQLHFYTAILPGFGSGDYHGLTIPIRMFANHSPANLFSQIFPSGPDLSREAHLLASLTSLALIAALAWGFRRRGDSLSRAGQVGTVAIVMLLTPVYTYEHHLVWAIPAFVVSASAIARGRLSRRWIVPIALAWACWAAHPYVLRDASRALGESGWSLLAWMLQEAKFAALLVFGAAAFQLGRRVSTGPTTEATKESSPAPGGARDD